jgi:hypothetical protein
MISTLAPFLLLWISFDAYSEARRGGTGSRVLANAFDDVLFTNAELHMLIDSAPSTMDNSTKEAFTNICEEFIQNNLKMSDFGIINFGVTVTGQVLLNKERRYLLRGIRRVSEQERKALAINTVVSVEYTHPHGDHIDPSDFHRYLRLLLNSRGSKLVMALKQANVAFFQNTHTILSFSSKINTESSDDESEEANASTRGLNSWTIAVLAVVGVAAVFLTAFIAMYCVRTHRLRKTQRAHQRRVKLSSFDESPEYLNLTQERSCFFDAPTLPSSDRCSVGGPSNSLATQSDERSPSTVHNINPDQSDTSAETQDEAELKYSPVFRGITDGCTNDTSPTSIDTAQQAAGTQTVEDLRNYHDKIVWITEASDIKEPVESVSTPEEIHLEDSQQDMLPVSHSRETSECATRTKASVTFRDYPEDDEGRKECSDNEYLVQSPIQAKELHSDVSQEDEHPMLHVNGDKKVELKEASSGLDAATPSDKRSKARTSSTSKSRRCRKPTRQIKKSKKESIVAFKASSETRSITRERQPANVVPAPWRAVGLALTPVITLHPDSASVSSVSESDTDVE